MSYQQGLQNFLEGSENTDDSQIYINETEENNEDNDGEDNDININGETITYGQDPTMSDWKLVALYTDRMQKDMIRRWIWQIGYDSINERLVMLSGLENGKKTISSRKVEINKKNNNLQKQALIEARSRYHDKLNEGYRPLGEELPINLQNAKPMLANKYYPDHYVIDKKTGKNKLVKSNIKRWPVAAMAKLDGVRSLARIKLSSDVSHSEGVESQNKVEMRSRENNTQIHTPQHLLHIRNELEIFFRYLPINSELDGELYSHDMDFNTLSSAISTGRNGETNSSNKKKKLIIHPRHNEVQYFIFDIIEPQRLCYDDRYLLLINAYRKYLEDGYKNNCFFLLSVTLAYCHDDIVEFHQSYVDMGYEGLMVRKLAGNDRGPINMVESQYLPKRCNNLLKYKEFSDEETTIIAVTDGKGTDERLAMLNVKRDNGDEITVRPRASFKQRADWYLHPEEIIGKRYTIRYFELTPDGKPRFPVGIAIRDYE